MGMGNNVAALAVRSPLVRDRPWVCDTVWVAHESLPLFARLAAMMPTRGWWALGRDGASPFDSDPVPNLVEMMADWMTRADPCVVNFGPYQRGETIEAASAAAGSQRVEVLDKHGAVWFFDHDYIEAALIGQKPWTWRLASEGEGMVLIGVDHKDRPRFAVFSLTAPDDSNG